MKRARALEVGDRIMVPGVDTALEVTLKYRPYNGHQSVITSDGISRQWPLEWMIELADDDG